MKLFTGIFFLLSCLNCFSGDSNLSEYKEFGKRLALELNAGNLIMLQNSYDEKRLSEFIPEQVRTLQGERAYQVQFGYFNQRAERYELFTQHFSKSSYKFLGVRKRKGKIEAVYRLTEKNIDEASFFNVIALTLLKNEDGEIQWIDFKSFLSGVSSLYDMQDFFRLSSLPPQQMMLCLKLFELMKKENYQACYQIFEMLPPKVTSIPMMAKFRLQLAVQSGDLTELLRAKKLIPLLKEDETMFFIITQILHQLNEPTQAQEYFNKFQEIVGFKDAYIDFHWASLLSTSGKNAEAMEMIKACIKSEPIHRVFYTELKNIESEAKLPKEKCVADRLLKKNLTLVKQHEAIAQDQPHFIRVIDDYESKVISYQKLNAESLDKLLNISGEKIDTKVTLHNWPEKGWRLAGEHEVEKGVSYVLRRSVNDEKGMIIEVFVIPYSSKFSSSVKKVTSNFLIGAQLDENSARVLEGELGSIPSARIYFSSKGGVNKFYAVVDQVVANGCLYTFRAISDDPRELESKEVIAARRGFWFNSPPAEHPVTDPKFLVEFSDEISTVEMRDPVTKLTVSKWPKGRNWEALERADLDAYDKLDEGSARTIFGSLGTADEDDSLTLSKEFKGQLDFEEKENREAWKIFQAADFRSMELNLLKNEFIKRNNRNIHYLHAEGEGHTMRMWTFTHNKEAYNLILSGDNYDPVEIDKLLRSISFEGK